MEDALRRGSRLTWWTKRLPEVEGGGGGGRGGGGAHRHSAHTHQQDGPTPLKSREAPFGFRGYTSRAPWSGGWGLWSRGHCLPP